MQAKEKDRAVRIGPDAKRALDKILAHYQKPLPNGVRITASGMCSSLILKEARRLGLLS
jgi:hypothetical protein